MRDAHSTPYTGHPKCTKMYQDLQRNEERHCRIYTEMKSSPAGEGGTYETPRLISAATYSQMEVGEHHNVLRNGLTVHHKFLTQIG